MSERKLILAACLVGGVIASCTPYPEGPQPPVPSPDPAAGGTVTDAEQQKLQEERRKAKEEADRKAAEEQAAETDGQSDEGSTAATDDQQPGDYPYASAVPGKPGFVFSPYNNKVIDVRDIPAGTLVQDPTYPASEKKYFRVP